jgi:hypothetical protein
MPFIYIYYRSILLVFFFLSNIVKIDISTQIQQIRGLRMCRQCVDLVTKVLICVDYYFFHMRWLRKWSIKNVKKLVIYILVATQNTFSTQAMSISKIISTQKKPHFIC